LKRLAGLLVIILISGKVFSQDTLPHFTVVERGGKVIISWVNPYKNLVQLNVQRSFDSLRYFSTIYSATSPQLPQNGFSDLKMPTNRIFYRIFYVLEGGSYFFTDVRRVGSTAAYSSARDVNNPSFNNVDPNDLRLITIKIKDTVYREIPANAFRAFRDSVLKQTKDTLIAINDQLVVLNPYFSKEVWRASSYVFVNKDGYLNVSLPLANEKKYHIKFFEENGSPLFEINHLPDPYLIVDKSNFIHAGWFVFELYENDKLKERNKFYLPKDF
jgi:hypothetical protein